ncbi:MULTISPECIES: hypothetical protein [unclassified Streptomyces]|uniref:hypothetical protein n=1 Tax=unclassified Streptomyces TaxID=2593676 RepID=UPI000DC7C9E0|nr:MULTISPECIES: hypothetical protein [unclassified Streptomyces]AWZ08463.1 hypothetical protein DRB89_32115 [Streptomyces sp. ICC4]AWZ13988.1 hypothetical protein DRB96_18745 [Streptomyces sp. ICC1]
MTRSDVLPAVSAVSAVTAVPAVRTARAAAPVCHALTVTVQDGGHALTRISSMLNNLSVRALSFRASEDGGPAVCEIVVPASDSPRAQAKLLRCVEVVGLTARLASDQPVG